MRAKQIAAGIITAASPRRWRSRVQGYEQVMKPIGLLH